MDRPVQLEGMANPALRVEVGKVVIDSLDVMADMGFHDFEIGNPQRLLISVELWLDGAEAPPENDDPSRAWDYDFIVKEIRRLSSERRYNLQETLAHALFQRFAEARGVRAIRIKTVKPDVYPDAAGVGVEIASFKGTAP